MTSAVRFLGTGLILSLLLVPALTRAGQALDPGRHPDASFSFSKSVDVPPDLVCLAPDRVATPLDFEALLYPVRGAVIASDDALPTPPDLFSSDFLRGPPLA